MATIIWTDRVQNEEILHGVKKGRNILHTVKQMEDIELAATCAEIAC
jgi:hypothetical protein